MLTEYPFNRRIRQEGMRNFIAVHCYQSWPLQTFRVTVDDGWNDVLAVKANKPLMKLILGARRQNIEVKIFIHAFGGNSLCPQLSLHITNLNVGYSITRI